MDAALQAALETFDGDALRGEQVVHAERAIPLERVAELMHRLDPAFRTWAAPAPKTDALERLELAADLDGIMGDVAWGLPIDAVADAYALADEPHRAFELRLRALARTPRWDGVLAARQLARVARDLRARGRDDDAVLLDRRAARLDPGTDRARVALGDCEPLDDGGFVDLLLADEYGSLLGDHFASPRRFALACVRRGEIGMARLPLAVTKKWQPHVGPVAEALRLHLGEPFATAADNARLLAAIEATPQGSEALALSKKKTPNAFTANENSRVTMYAGLAAKGDWVAVRRGLADWHRQCRLFVGALLALHGDPLGTAYVERAGALATALSLDETAWPGWALPNKVLARRAGDTSVTWWGM